MKAGARALDLQPRVKAGSAEETQCSGPSRPSARDTVLFVFKKDSFSASRATVFTPNLMEVLFNSGRQAQKNWGKARSLGFYLGKRMGLVPTTKFGTSPPPPLQA